MPTANATPSNLDRFKKDLDTLIAKGEQLEMAIQAETFPSEFADAVKKHKKQLGDEAKGILAALPSFTNGYQPWYSEAKALIKQLLPDRLADFVRHYEKPKSRKDISVENYCIEH